MLVAAGILQYAWNSYTELYIPIACVELVHILLSIKNLSNWEMEHVDIKGAFLYAYLPSFDKIVVRLQKINRDSDANG